jgi:hypothetical protein
LLLCHDVNNATLFLHLGLGGASQQIVYSTITTLTTTVSYGRQHLTDMRVSFISNHYLTINYNDTDIHIN